MGNRPKEKIVKRIFDELDKHGRLSVSALAERTKLHMRTVESYLHLLTDVQSKPQIKEMKTTGGSLYYLEKK